MVVAGLGDTLKRPAQNISLNQSMSLAAASLIYTRYSMVITPKNYSMLAVNAAIVIIQSFLIAKHLKWRSEGAQETVYNYSDFPLDPDDW
nr:mitochondrial pyruvate carrier 3-like isoform X2 [Drosophila kikkawai]XP_041631804.1 mitochondrial pyruvate carrier 3-like isoform X2 [Drosophila kikkawai]